MLYNPLPIFAATPSSADWVFAAMWLVGGAAVALALRPVLGTLARPLRLQEVAITIRETLRREQITIPFPQRVLHLADPAATEALTAAVDPRQHPGEPAAVS